MCGIAGYVTGLNKPDLQDDLCRAIHSIRHRGPDGDGVWSDDNGRVGLGHRRLSIIDLSDAGTQPMQSTNGQVILVYNGEVYNFLQLRRELENKGYQFKSQTDTEVIINAYLEWGIECFSLFVGMFAFAIWDQRKRKIFLVRDRIGIKPLYYYFHNDTLLFASELKAIMSFKLFPRQVDEDALSLFLHYQYIPAPHTIFNNTYKLLPGSYLTFDGNRLSRHIFWSIPKGTDVEQFTDDEDETTTVEQLDTLLTQAVSDRLVSDVPLGALLSGGIDSSLVTALMQKVSDSPIQTFSIGFGESQYNESHYAKIVSSHLGTIHNELYLEPNQILSHISSLPDIFDEPFADSSALPTYLVSQLTKKKVTVALSGDGGDELFAGYVRHWMTSSMSKNFAMVPDWLRKLAATLMPRVPAHWVEKSYMTVRSKLPRKLQIANVQDKWQKFLFSLDKDSLEELYRTTVCLWDNVSLKALLGRSVIKSRFDELFEETNDLPELSRLLIVDQHTYLPDGMLTKVDRASMANGLEIRVPLLDHRVVEFTARLPENYKFRDGSAKYLLKKVLYQYVPEKLMDRPKMGFGMPIDQWLRGPLKPLLCDYLAEDRLKEEGRFNGHYLRQKMDLHLNGKQNHHHRLWAALMWEMWRERWLG